MNTYNFVRMFDLRGADANSVPDIYGNVERSVGLLHRNGESTIYAAAGQNLSFDSKGLMVPTGTVFVTSVNNDILIGR